MGRLYHNDLMETQNLGLFVCAARTIVPQHRKFRGELRPLDPVRVEMGYAKYSDALRVSLVPVLLKNMLSRSTHFP